MRMLVIKRIVFLLVLLLGYSAVNAADADLITKQITIKLDKAGTLPDKIGSSKKFKITNLKIIGEINGRDLRLIREMAGGTACIGGDAYASTNTKGKLNKLDLSEAIIVGDSENSYAYSVGRDGGVTSYYAKDKDEIPYKMFYNCLSLQEIVIPPCIISIGVSAFESCRYLRSLTIPSGVASIGDYAFRDCGLTSLTLPSSISSIGDNTFEDCSGLTSLFLPSSITSIGDNAFCRCSGLTSLTIPLGVTSIGSCAFWACSGLTSLTLPSSITSIGDYAFSDCSNLTSLTLPSSITSIGDDAFSCCGNLTSVQYQIDDDIDAYLLNDHPCIEVECGIEYYLNNKKMINVVIPSTITKLGKYVFQRSKDLTSVYVSWETPISAGTAFDGVDVSKCTLYVPQGAYQDYWLTDVWGDFGNIVEYDVTGIDNVTDTNDTQEISRYSVNGQRLSAPTKGLNIVKYSDGSVKKVAVQ